jgi:Ca2+-binding EF-hand superfamily protein
MSVENIEKFFNKIDADGSGTISIEELMGLFKKHDTDGRF